jgi:hypothetical protein
MTTREEILQRHLTEIAAKSDAYIRELGEERARIARLEAEKRALADEISRLKVALSLAELGPSDAHSLGASRRVGLPFTTFSKVCTLTHWLNSFADRAYLAHSDRATN